MNSRFPDYYHGLRSPFTPQAFQRIFVGEAPPVSGKYLYDDVRGELFTALMQAHGIEAQTKRDGLLALARAGSLFLDAAYVPIDGPGWTAKRRKGVIREAYQALASLLCQFPPVPLILIKATVYDAIGERLREDGLRVLNFELGSARADQMIPFPSTGHERRAIEIMRRAEKQLRETLLAELPAHHLIPSVANTCVSAHKTLI